MFQSSLRDGLIEYIDGLREIAIEGYRHAQSLYVAGGLKDKPDVPEILKLLTEGGA